MENKSIFFHIFKSQENIEYYINDENNQGKFLRKILKLHLHVSEGFRSMTFNYLFFIKRSQEKIIEVTYICRRYALS